MLCRLHGHYNWRLGQELLVDLNGFVIVCFLRSVVCTSVSSSCYLRHFVTCEFLLLLLPEVFHFTSSFGLASSKFDSAFSGEICWYYVWTRLLLLLISIVFISSIRLSLLNLDASFASSTCKLYFSSLEFL